MDNVAAREDILRRPVPTYQHYVENFEELYRQSPLAKVIVKDIRPALDNSAECKSSGTTPSQAGPFKVPFSPMMLAPKPATSTSNLMSPVAQLIQQMQRGGASKNQSRGTGVVAGGLETSLARKSDLFENKENVTYTGAEQHADLVAVETSTGTQGQVETGEKQVESGETQADSVDGDGAGVEDMAGPEAEDDRMGEDVERHSPVSSKDLDENGTDGDQQRTMINQSGCVPTNPTPISRALRSADVATTDDTEKHGNSSWNETPKTSKKKETVLDQWIIKWIGSGQKHIAVEGHREEDPEGSFWHSTPIFHRISSRLLETSSGSRYRLKGSMNKLLTIEQGFSLVFVNRFQRGFPPAWKELIAREANGSNVNSKTTSDTDATCRKNNRSSASAQKPTKTASSKKAKKSVKQVLPREKHQTEQTPTGQRMAEREKKKSSWVKSAEAGGGVQKTPVCNKKVAIVVTPICIHIDKVRTTQSGRKIIPPLHYWAGQRQRTIPCLEGATEILEGSTDYTPVSSTSVRLTGSIDISERMKRHYGRKSQSRTTTGSARNPSTESENEKSFCDTDMEGSSGSKKEHIAGRKKTSSRSRTKRGGRSSKSAKECPPGKRDGEAGSNSESNRTSLQRKQSKGRSKDAAGKHQKSKSRNSKQDRGQKFSQTHSQVTREGKPVHPQSKKTTEAGSSSAEKEDPYDLYGAVMGVVQQHKHKWQSIKDNLRHAREGRKSLSPSAVNPTANCSYSISDDEDFSSDSPPAATRRRPQTRRERRSEKRMPSEDRPQKNDSTAQSTSLSGATSLKSKRRAATKANKLNERILLGSSMLPASYLEKVGDRLHDDAGHEDNGRSDSGESDMETSRQRRKSSKQRNSRRSKEKKAASKKEDVIDDTEAEKGEKWQPDELQRLQRALKTIAPSSQQFWLRVAASVGTRTEWECQRAHQSGLEGTSRPPSRTKAASEEASKVPQEPVALTATKGTMRRKRQLKDFIQQHNQKADDDLFDSTPFKKQKMTTKTLENLALADEEESDDDTSAKTPGSARLKTPSTRFHSLLAPLSSKKTPHSRILSPGLLQSVEKKYMDQYIHGIQKKRAVGRRGKRSPEPLRKTKPKGVRVDSSPGDVSTSDVFKIDPIPDQGADEEEGEADYYWSDEDH